MNGSPTPAPNPEDPSKLDRLPSTYQAITDYFGKLGQANPFVLRNETFKRIEKTTGRPLICYVTKTHHVPAGVPAYIDDSDLTGFGDLIHAVAGDALDVFIVSNGGSAEAAERIVLSVDTQNRPLMCTNASLGVVSGRDGAIAGHGTDRQP